VRKYCQFFPDRRLNTVNGVIRLARDTET
jgi:hypothetical protein